METEDKKIILFDGVCNLCSGVVQFIIRRDKKDQFRFASLQGKTGEHILKKFGLSSTSINSFILIDGQTAYTRSTGALRMVKYLGGPWSLFYSFIIVPKIIRNSIYNLIARNRYQWFGRKQECWIPTPELKSKFLD